MRLRILCLVTFCREVSAASIIVAKRRAESPTQQGRHQRLSVGFLCLRGNHPDRVSPVLDSYRYSSQETGPRFSSTAGWFRGGDISFSVDHSQNFATPQMSWPRILWSYETVSLPLQWLWWSCAVGRMRLKGLKRSASVSEKPTDLRRGDMVMRCRAALQKPSNERWKPKIQRQAQLRSPLLHLELFPQPSAISLESTCGWGLVEDWDPRCKLQTGIWGSCCAKPLSAWRTPHSGRIAKTHKTLSALSGMSSCPCEKSFVFARRHEQG
jgi:hypothetical protein